MSVTCIALRSRTSITLASAANITAFFFLTYALTWACWVPVVVGRIRGTAVLSVLWIAGVFAPSLVSLTLTMWERGRASVRSLLSRTVQWDVGLR